jgi:2-C-methyl-D-erythritol 4-phosphate cytidylyltransferase
MSLPESSAAPPAPRCFALVPCAGSGQRAGTPQPKQYHRVAGRAVVARTLDALLRVPRISAVLVVLSPGDTGFAEAVPVPGPRVRSAEVGGATRAASVAAGLAELAAQGARHEDWVLVHDAARCLVDPADIDRLIDTCQGDPVGGLLALPLPDTLKRADAQGRVGATVPREGIWAAQTPQMFRLGELRAALAAAGDAVTDEASALEAQGRAPRLVAGSADNFKLTFPTDFARAERVLASRSAGDER